LSRVATAWARIFSRVGPSICLRIEMVKSYVAEAGLAEILADRPDDVRPDANGFHEWQIKLDRHVYLDHGWENQKDELPAYYLCRPGEAVGLPREDNNSTGVPGYSDKDTLETA
jgi:hypothetical protein